MSAWENFGGSDIVLDRALSDRLLLRKFLMAVKSFVSGCQTVL